MFQNVISAIRKMQIRETEWEVREWEVEEDMMVRVGLLEKVISEQKLEGGEGVTGADIWRKYVPGRENGL